MLAIFGETEPANGLREEIPLSSLRLGFCRDPLKQENDNKHASFTLKESMRDLSGRDSAEERDT